MGTTVGEIGEILRMIEASPFEEVVIELEGARITARRPATPAGARAPLPAAATPSPAAASPLPQRRTLPQPAGKPGPAAAPYADLEALAREAARRTSPPPQASVAQGLLAVRAPMVGTFFRRPSPDEPVLVEVGQRVEQGQPLCLIEVMKLFTMIEAPVDGVIEAILADDGALVEYDQPLFAIRATAGA